MTQKLLSFRTLNGEEKKTTLFMTTRNTFVESIRHILDETVDLRGKSLLTVNFPRCISIHLPFPAVYYSARKKSFAGINGWHKSRSKRKFAREVCFLSKNRLALLGQEWFFLRFQRFDLFFIGVTRGLVYKNHLFEMIKKADVLRCTSSSLYT